MQVALLNNKASSRVGTNGDAIFLLRSETVLLKMRPSTITLYVMGSHIAEYTWKRIIRISKLAASIRTPFVRNYEVGIPFDISRSSIPFLCIIALFAEIEELLRSERMRCSDSLFVIFVVTTFLERNMLGEEEVEEQRGVLYFIRCRFVRGEIFSSVENPMRREKMVI